MKTSDQGHDLNNIIDLFSGQPYKSGLDLRFIRLAPELDGLEMLYSNDSSDNKLYSLKVLAWGLRACGEVVGIVPWLDGIIACTDIQDPLNGKFEGYYDNGIDEIFLEAPIHKIVEVETAAEYYEHDSDNPEDIIQEIPDLIGTHAVLSDTEKKRLSLFEVVSWRLLNNGDIQGMLIDDKQIKSTPVLPGDSCLYAAQEHKQFKYFFQHHIANKIKDEDPEALAAISSLVDDGKIK